MITVIISNYKKITKLIFLYLYLLIFLSSKSFAHGGLSLEDDYCILKVGRYEMHFSGYQPENNGPKEFCEDIPETGNTIIVLDYMDDDLRAIPVEVRIIVDTEEEYKDLDSVTIYKKDYEIYRNGTISLRHNFDSKGKYIGYVTANENNNFIISEFPFSVGIEKKNSSYIFYIIFALLVGALLFYLGNKFRNKSMHV